MTEANTPTLKQTVGVTQMALYAVGAMLGAGIYGLIGQAAGISGNAVWMAFIVAGIAALLTALTYASLGSRYPRAGGSAYIAERAFASPKMGFIVGLCLACAAIIGVPTMAQVFARNFAELFQLGDHMIPFVAEGFLIALALIIFRGIQETMWLNILCCIIEAGGLLFVIATGFSHWGDVNYLEIPEQAATVIPGIPAIIVAVMGSTMLTFFAFNGFEDVLNIAEETKNPQRTLPLGLMIAMGIVSVLYIAVAITVVSVVPWHQLASSRSPLTDVIRVTAPHLPAHLFTVIALFSVTNTILIGYVTVSRLIYGMSRQNLLPAILGRVHGKRRTPHIAVFVLLLCFTPFAIYGRIDQLAAASTILFLSVFAMMNISLVMLQRRDSTKGLFEIHPVFPIMGAIVCTTLVIARVVTGEWTAPVIAAGMAVGVAVVYELAKKRRSL